MATRVRLEGLTELRNALRRLPTDLAEEAATIVEAHANLARTEIQAGYPTGPTGNLKRRVTVTHNAGRRVSAVAVVKSAAPHAWIFEHGTRRRVTERGRNRGRMPEATDAQQMIPKVIRIRRRMVTALIALVRRAGFEVTE